MIAIVFIVIILFAGFLLLMRRRPQYGMVEREVVSRKEHLADQQAVARTLRCGAMAKPGVRSCKRGPNRPCVPHCRGRLDIKIDWDGD